MPFIPTTSTIQQNLNYIKDGTPHIALYTSSPNAGGGGTEVSGASYARQPVVFGAITGGSMSNNAAINFDSVPKATITHYAILSAETGGTMYGYGALNTPAQTELNDQINFAANSVTISVAGS